MATEQACNNKNICAICLDSLCSTTTMATKPKTSATSSTPTKGSKSKSENIFGAVVPCGHCFHKKCFRRWTQAQILQAKKRWIQEQQQQHSDESSSSYDFLADENQETAAGAAEEVVAATSGSITCNYISLVVVRCPVCKVPARKFCRLYLDLSSTTGSISSSSSSESNKDGTGNGTTLTHNRNTRNNETTINGNKDYHANNDNNENVATGINKEKKQKEQYKKEEKKKKTKKNEGTLSDGNLIEGQQQQLLLLEQERHEWDMRLQDAQLKRDEAIEFANRFRLLASNALSELAKSQRLLEETKAEQLALARHCRRGGGACKGRDTDDE